MRKAKKLELKSVDLNDNPSEKPHQPDLFVNIDGEAVMTTPIKLEYFEDQLTVRGAENIPNQN